MLIGFRDTSEFCEHRYFVNMSSDLPDCRVTFSIFDEVRQVGGQYFSSQLKYKFSTISVLTLCNEI